MVSAVVSISGAVDSELELPQIVAAPVIPDAPGAFLYKEAASPKEEKEEEYDEEVEVKVEVEAEAEFRAEATFRS